MNITDELREESRGIQTFTCMTEHAEQLLAIADRIDAKHEAALRRKFIDAVLCSTESVMMLASELAERYIELPKDADDEYIHEHDKVDWRDHTGTWHENATVVAVCDDGCYVMGGTVFHVHKSDIRHHHDTTVEDVMHQFLGECDSAISLGYDEVPHEVFAKYAAKLHLAEGKEQ